MFYNTRMSIFRACVILILLSSLLPGGLFAYQGFPGELEPLVILKRKQLSLKSYFAEKEQDDAFNYQSGLEGLVNLPVDVQSRALQGGMEAGFSLRASTFQQVLVLLNGQRINEPQTAYYNSDIPFTRADIEKVEVIPGACSSLFGPDSVGGAVNFSLSRPGEKKIVWESGMGSERNGYTLFSAGGRMENLGLRFSAEESRSRGFRQDTDYEKFTSSLNVSYQSDRLSWQNNFGYQEKDFGAYDFYTPGQGYPSRESTRTYLFSSGLDLDCGALRVKPDFLWRRHYNKFVLDKTGLRSASVNQHRTDIFTPGIYLQRDLGPLGRLGFGSEWSMEKITSTNLGRHSRTRSGIFLDENIPLGEKWEAGSCVRWEKFSGFGDVFTGSLNLKFTLTPEVSFNFGIARNMRLPSFTELYYSDPTTEGNSSLAAETAWNYETGLEYENEGFVSRFSLFMRREREMIDWVRSDSSQKWQAKNFTRDEVFGVEYVMHKAFNSFLSLDANYSYADKKIDNQGYMYKYGPNYARHLANAVFNLDLFFGRQEFGFNYKKRPGRRGWLLFNSGLNWDLNENTRVFLRGENIFNVEYQDIEGIPQPGRYIEAGLKLKW